MEILGASFNSRAETNIRNHRAASFAENPILKDGFFNFEGRDKDSETIMTEKTENLRAPSFNTDSPARIKNREYPPPSQVGCGFKLDRRVERD